MFFADAKFEIKDMKLAI